MARIVCLPEFLKAMIVDETETLECSFAVLDSILYKNSCVWKLTSVQADGIEPMNLFYILKDITELLLVFPWVIALLVFIILGTVGAMLM